MNWDSNNVPTLGTQRIELKHYQPVLKLFLTHACLDLSQIESNAIPKHKFVVRVWETGTLHWLNVSCIINP